MMEDDILYYIYTYGIWVLLAIAVIKLVYLLLNRPNLSYTLKRYFFIYTDSRIVKDDTERYQFRIVHNTLTWILYLVLVIWILVWFIVVSTR